MGHQPYVSILELKQFISLEGTIKSRGLGMFAQSNERISIKPLGGTISRMNTLLGLDNINGDYLELLVDSIYQAQQSMRINKVGVFSNVSLNKQKVIQVLKQTGAKKINVLEKDAFPSIGHVKSGLAWFGIIRTKEKVICCVIEEYADQEYWQALDRSIPNNDMQRGIMNLKLSRVLMNLTLDRVIWDPFCGQGRTLVGGLSNKEELIASDKDGFLLPQLQQNIDSAYQIEKHRNENLEKPKLILFEHDVTEPIDHQLLPESGFSVVTEGYLGPSLSNDISAMEIHENFEHISGIWRNFFSHLQLMSVKDIIICIPAYKVDNKFVIHERFLDSLESWIPTHSLESKYNDIYARKNARVGHHILILRRK